MRETLSGSGNFEVPAGVTMLRVTLVAGGGAGGGSQGDNIGSGGGGGGAGGAILLRDLAVEPNASLAYVVGAGGAGVSAGNGLAGSATTFSTLTAGGGAGGKKGTNNELRARGGLQANGTFPGGGGGAEVAGLLSNNGDRGAFAQYLSVANSGAVTAGGVGGNGAGGSGAAS